MSDTAKIVVTPAPVAPITTADPAKPTTPAAVVAPVVEPPRPLTSPALAELSRKEFAFRQEKKKWDDERRASESSAAERTANEAKWKADPQALLEAHGHSLDAVIDFFAKGGADSPEGQIRALRTQIERDKKAAEDAHKKKLSDDEQAAKEESKQAAIKIVHTECNRLFADPRFELCSITPGVAEEAVALIVRRWNEDQIDLTPEQALLELETELDKRDDKYAQSKKRLAKLGQPKPDGAAGDPVKPDASRLNPVPSAKSPTITIKNRNQAVAPVRKAADGRASKREVTAAVAANLSRLFQG